MPGSSGIRQGNMMKTLQNTGCDVIFIISLESLEGLWQFPNQTIEGELVGSELTRQAQVDLVEISLTGASCLNTPRSVPWP